MKFKLNSIIGGEETVNENGSRYVTMGISAPAIVDMAWRMNRAGDKENAENIIVSGWPSLPYLAVKRLINSEYTVEGSDVIVDVPEITD